MTPAGYVGKPGNIQHSEKTADQFEILFPEFSCSLGNAMKNL